MKFKEAYEKYNKIIHYLLKSYQITYNYDEFYECLHIKMWQLILNFDEQQSSSLHSYLFIRLKFYLIDTFRKESLRLDTCNIDILNHIDQVPTPTINDSKLLLEELTRHLSPREHHWLSLFLQGYKQYEIAQLMNLSPSTIKKIKSTTKFHLQLHLKKMIKEWITWNVCLHKMFSTFKLQFLQKLQC